MGLSYSYFKKKNFLPYCSLVLIGLMWTIPFLFPYHRYPIPSFYDELIAAVFGLIAFALFLQKRFSENIQFPRFGLAILGLIGLLVLQLIVGDIAYYQRSLLGILYLIWALALIITAHMLRKEVGLEKIAITLSWFLVTGGVLSTIVTIMQQYGIYKLFGVLIVMPKLVPSAYGNLGQPNLFADYICLTLVSLIYLQAMGKLHKIITILVGMLLLSILVLTASRISLVFLVSIPLVAFIFYVRDKSVKNRTLLISTLLLIPGIVIAHFLITLLPSNPSNEILTIHDKVVTQGIYRSTRLTLWREAWQMFLQYPLLGIGFGQFAWHHYLLLDSPLPEAIRIYGNAHNLLLQLLAEMGIVAATLVVVFIALWLLSFFRQKLAITHWWIFTLLTILALHSMVEFPLWYMFFLGIAAVLLGLGETHMNKLKISRIIQPLVIAYIVLGVLIIKDLALNYRHIESMVFGANKAKNISNEEALKILDRIHRESLLSPYIEYAYAQLIPYDRNHINEKLALNYRIMHLTPGSHFAFQRGILLALKGDFEAAQQELDRASRNANYVLETGLFKLREVANKQDGEVTNLYRYVAKRLCSP